MLCIKVSSCACRSLYLSAVERYRFVLQPPRQASWSVCTLRLRGDNGFCVLPAPAPLVATHLPRRRLYLAASVAFYLIYAPGGDIVRWANTNARNSKRSRTQWPPRSFTWRTRTLLSHCSPAPSGEHSVPPSAKQPTPIFFSRFRLTSCPLVSAMDPPL